MGRSLRPLRWWFLTAAYRWPWATFKLKGHIDRNQFPDSVRQKRRQWVKIYGPGNIHQCRNSKVGVGGAEPERNWSV